MSPFLARTLLAVAKSVSLFAGMLLYVARRVAFVVKISREFGRLMDSSLVRIFVDVERIVAFVARIS